MLVLEKMAHRQITSANYITSISATVYSGFFFLFLPYHVLIFQLFFVFFYIIIFLVTKTQPSCAKFIPCLTWFISSAN